MTRITRENLVYGFTALGSLVLIIWVIPAYSPAYPGYGVPATLVPRVAAGIICALSALALVRNAIAYYAAKTAEAEEAQSPVIAPDDRAHLWHLVRFMVPCILLMPGMKWIGFFPAGIAFLLVIQLLCGQRKPVALVLVAVIPVVVMYAAMRYALGVPMP
ncbi:hypothetical protein DPQ33_15810 [Oceanidesulfovibrio indonesiensis]|uniref:DUF1468 domain-containing protein n=1 Tax=Oceanidesulfovibrio indonesiensis TaxID=54767 RepID=A0A7M3MAZ8_9BACT|nr:tripartite tricarboxylate transporter TctB family protein [Oceanidesulfovibrio indonesiensis]TVM15159.1 hypothetical protein DPQ33_15810 [Oceanidesulfovibrio indonesiensis]